MNDKIAHTTVTMKTKYNHEIACDLINKVLKTHFYTLWHYSWNSLIIQFEGPWLLTSNDKFA